MLVIFLKSEMSIRKEAEGLRAHFIAPLHEINAKNHQKVGTPYHDVNVCECVCSDCSECLERSGAPLISFERSSRVLECYQVRSE